MKVVIVVIVILLILSFLGSVIGNLLQPDPMSKEWHKQQVELERQKQLTQQKRKQLANSYRTTAFTDEMYHAIMKQRIQ